MKRPRQARQARQALVWGLGSFVLLQIGLAVAIEYWIPGFRDPEYGYKISRLYKQLKEHPAPAPTVVMVGSSRTLDGLRAGPLQETLTRELRQPLVVFNFGVTGSGPFAELVYFHRLLKQHLRPDVLLIEVLPPLLTAQNQADLSRYPAHRLWHCDLSVAERYEKRGRRLRADWWVLNPLPAFSHRYAIASLLLPLLLPDDLRQDWAHGMDKSGWLAILQHPSSEVASRSRATIRALEDYEPLLRNFHPGGPECMALEEILQTCRRRGITAALVLMPEGTAFRAIYPPIALQRLDDYLAGLQARFGVKIIDARGWVSDDGFVDSHHLLPGGAAVFSSRLGREALVPLLRARLVFSGNSGRIREKPGANE